jgi:GDPmannose 4,6-dehydratase
LAGPRRALITGASGQDGHYLARHLIEQGKDVLGVSRRLPTDAVGRNVVLDLCRHEDLRALLVEFAPDEVYHLAAYNRSSAAVAGVAAGSTSPVAAPGGAAEEDLYFASNVEATRALLRMCKELLPGCRVFLASSCHIFGDTEEFPQTERTPIRPNSVYGITKATSLWLGRYFRESLGLFCATGILYNHESPQRGPSFVTGRIARGVAQIVRGEASALALGDLQARVDWGYAGDYVRAMALMLEAEQPQDLIIGSGALHRVGDFVELAFAHVGLDWQKYVHESATVHRPVAKAVYHGDISAIRRLGWQPKLPFEELVRQMVDAQLDPSRR